MTRWKEFGLTRKLFVISTVPNPVEGMLNANGDVLVCLSGDADVGAEGSLKLKPVDGAKSLVVVVVIGLEKVKPDEGSDSLAAVVKGFDRLNPVVVVVVVVVDDDAVVEGVVVVGGLEKVKPVDGNVLLLAVVAIVFPKLNTVVSLAVVVKAEVVAAVVVVALGKLNAEEDDAVVAAGRNWNVDDD